MKDFAEDPYVVDCFKKAALKRSGCPDASGKYVHE